MGVFVYRGPLAPDSPLFRGREAELARLTRLCQGEVQAYATVYGGRQAGKTSLLLRLATRLPEPVHTCRVDFQGIPGATTRQVYTYLAQRVAQGLLSQAKAPQVNDAPGLIEFLCQAIDQPEIGRFVLLLEELGALPQPSREDLAHVLRSMFTNRFDPSCRPLARLMVVLAGGVEMYELAATQVSPLQNICEPIYLSDLSEGEAVGLVAGVLTELGLPRIEAEALGRAIYTQVAGHPYLTQRLGGALEAGLAAGESLAPAHVDSAVEQLLSGDPLLHHLRRALTEQDLLAASKTLLDGRLRFSRLDEEMARLELLGLAREADGCWVVRNRLLAKALQDWVTASPDQAQPSGDLAEGPAASKPIRVFISSTWEDLQPEREAVEEALHRMQDTAFAGMEYFGSRPETPKEVSLAEVDRSDVYIGIFAHRYGSGITEAEYLRARERGLPCLIYLKDDSVPVPPAHIERDAAKVAKLEALKRELKGHHTLSFFKSPDQLATQVVADLHNLLKSAPTVRSEEPPQPGPKYQITITDGRGVVIGDQAQVSQQFGAPALSQWSEPDLLRLQHLADNIRQDLALLKDYEDALRYEDDPRRRAKYRREIEQLRESADRYRQEYDELQAQVTGEPSVAMQDIAAQLRQMDTKLNALLAGQAAIRDDLSDLRQAVLARFDAGERTIIAAVVEQLDQSQLATVQAVLDAIETVHVPESELQETLTAVQCALSEIRQQEIALSDPTLVSEATRLSEVVDAPKLDVKHKLKVTAPIIPLILSYEGKVELGSGLNLEAAWQRLVQSAR